MIHVLKFYRVPRPIPLMDTNALIQHIKENSSPFTFSHGDDDSRDENGNLEHSDFIEDVLDYALGCVDVQGWTDSESNMMDECAFLVVDETEGVDNVGQIIWPKSIVL